MIGLLLGDGTLVKKYKGGGTYFKYAQGLVHDSDISHVFNLFSKAGLCNMIKPTKGSSFCCTAAVRHYNKQKKTYYYYSFTTKSLI